MVTCKPLVQFVRAANRPPVTRSPRAIHRDRPKDHFAHSIASWARLRGDRMSTPSSVSGMIPHGHAGTGDERAMPDS